MRRSFAEAQIIEVDEEQLASPASKLDAMFTFLKINFLSMWGTDNLTPQQEEAKIYKIKMQLETIDEDGVTKIDINDLRKEIKRLQGLQQADQIDDDFNPAMLAAKAEKPKSKNKSAKKQKKARAMELGDDSASVEPGSQMNAPDDEINQSAEFGGAPAN